MRTEEKSRDDEVTPGEEKLQDLHVSDQQAEETKAGPHTRLIIGHDQGLY